jgi:hypothetical protein
MKLFVITTKEDEMHIERENLLSSSNGERCGPWASCLF